MAKKFQYHFDAQSLTFKKAKRTLKHRLKQVSLNVAFSVALAACFCVAFVLLADSPKEKKLKRENDLYETELAHLNKRINLLSKVLEDIEHRDDNVYRLIFSSEPIPHAIRRSGLKEDQRYTTLQGYVCGQNILSTSKKIDTLSTRLYIQSKSIDSLFHLAKNRKELLAATPAIFPLNKETGAIISGFGERYHSILRYTRPHLGIDIAAAIGTPVFATAPGIVESTGRNYAGYGISIEIDHGFSYKTRYAHLSKSNVRVGQKVKRGEIIGMVGNTGLSAAPHLHYEVMVNGKHVNPIYFFFNDFTPSEYEKVIEQASEENQCLS